MWWLIFLISPCLALVDREPVLNMRRTRTTPVEGFVQVRLNHFMASDTRTFPMRYYYNSEFAGENLVILVGGEWAISPEWLQGGLAHEMAEQMNAGLFYTEHRFYGNTRPFSDSSLENLSFLSIDQALADLAQFIQHVKSDLFEDGRYKNATVALVGCSYAGTMATWMRLAYPHLVDAAFSDSGPLHAQENFPEYLEVVAEAIKEQGGSTCLTSLEESVQALVDLLATPAGPTLVSEMFGTCTVIQATTPLDVATFFMFGIISSLAVLVQYATPGDITGACAVLTAANVSDPVQRLANYVTSEPLWAPCLETRYTQVVANSRNTSFDAPESQMRLWLYQTCAEFGWYQTTTSSKQPFLSTVPLEYFHQICRDFYSSYFDEARLRSGIKRTNIFFGGLTHLPDRVVSVAGGHDPWSPMGPNSTHAHQKAPVYVVPGVSHCRAMQSTGSSDTAELETVKKAVLDHMYEFAIGPIDRPISSATDVGANMALLFTAAMALVRNW
ncbi:hypothetical protein B5X24_HaOG207976 [Helicoverpa armigera]|uniref:Serine protease K12H4.7 n=1 Tax=Helicoverpa armigera TaxID=29058 RepID=A0A2W1BRE4_HELAM|nr:hypothetical protein B5X24_HaOG207976 [Helicoverpa armigera]